MRSCHSYIHTLFLFTSSVWGLLRLVPTTCLPTHTLKGGRCIDDSHWQRWSPSCTLIALLCSKHCVAELLFGAGLMCTSVQGAELMCTSVQGRGSCTSVQGRGSCALHRCTNACMWYRRTSFNCENLIIANCEFF